MFLSLLLMMAPLAPVSDPDPGPVALAVVPVVDPDPAPAVRVVMPPVTVERTGANVLVYLNAKPAERYVLPADASADLIEQCKRRLAPDVYGPPAQAPVPPAPHPQSMPSQGVTAQRPFGRPGSASTTTTPATPAAQVSTSLPATTATVRTLTDALGAGRRGGTRAGSVGCNSFG